MRENEMDQRIINEEENCWNMFLTEKGKKNNKKNKQEQTKKTADLVALLPRGLYRMFYFRLSSDWSTTQEWNLSENAFINFQFIKARLSYSFFLPVFTSLSLSFSDNRSCYTTKDLSV